MGRDRAIDRADDGAARRDSSRRDGSRRDPSRPGSDRRSAERSVWSRRLAVWGVWLALPIVAVALVGPVTGQADSSPVPLSSSDSAGRIDPLAIDGILPGTAVGERVEEGIGSAELADFISAGPDEWTSPRGLVSTIKIMVLLTVLSLAPAIMMMTTSFVRIIVVFGLLRQALGTQQLPPSQVMTSLALFMTLLVMAPTFEEVKDRAILPYIESNGRMGWEEAWDKGTRPLRSFMARQIADAENQEDVWMFYRHLPAEERRQEPKTWNDIPLKVLLPAYMISELKVAFLIGFQIYLPFLVIDIVVSSVTISMGMLMLPPAMISLPFKLILFVLVDGWQLVVGMPLDSFVVVGGS